MTATGAEPGAAAGAEPGAGGDRSERLRRWQFALIGLGAVLLVIAAVTLLNDIPERRYLGIAAWLIGALIVHDGIAAMAIFGASVVLRRVGKRIPFVVILIVQGAIVVAVIVTVLVLPEIIKQQIGTASPSMLPLNYVGNLALFYAALAVVTTVGVASYLFASSRNRSSSSAKRV